MTLRLVTTASFVALVLSASGCHRNSADGPEPLKDGAVVPGRVVDSKSNRRPPAGGQLPPSTDPSGGQGLFPAVGGSGVLDASGATERVRLCPQRSDASPIAPGDDTPKVRQVHFDDLKSELSAACAECHDAVTPKTSAFRIVFEHKGREVIPGDYVQGLSEGAGRRLVRSLSNGTMPPAFLRERNHAHYEALAKRVLSWRDAGMPDGRFSVESSAVSRPFLPLRAGAGGIPGVPGTDAGDCVPDAALAGVDTKMDAFFASAKELPEDLADTDLATLDALELAKKGTFVYDVQFPLWADNAVKGRYVHVPALTDSAGRTLPVPIVFGKDSNVARIPANTRFYKTFYKTIVLANGLRIDRKVETRIIVTRGPGVQPLFGTYRWDEAEQSATLVRVPYRDGTGFKDVLFPVVVDEAHGTTRTYAIPGSQRCVECHKGSASRDFVLGFSPLQINRRLEIQSEIASPHGDVPSGEAHAVAPEALAQVDRLARYGVLDASTKASELPVLGKTRFFAEQLESTNPHELNFAAYAYGNCAHCHNPEGFAMRDSGVKLDLSPGRIFGVDVSKFETIAPEGNLKTLLLQNPDPAGDMGILYKRISSYREDRGDSQMPLHTPGGTDCRLKTLAARWILSKAVDPAMVALADTYVPPCEENPSSFRWIDLDATDLVGPYYGPRRGDWSSAMDARLLALDFTPDDTLDALAKTVFPMGYWAPKPGVCEFPEGNALPLEKQEAWMIVRGRPNFGRSKWGEMYFSTPGAMLFNYQCVFCHGSNADGKTGIAQKILNADGTTRVANLREGMFGMDGRNLDTFLGSATTNVSLPPQKNFAPNYLVWMSTGGTRAKFPRSVRDLMGGDPKVAGNMMRPLIVNCLKKIPAYETLQGGSNVKVKSAVMDAICGYRNIDPLDPMLAPTFDVLGNTIPSPAGVAYETRVAQTIGYLLYAYLRDEVAKGKPVPTQDQCDLVPEFKMPRQ